MQILGTGAHIQQACENFASCFVSGNVRHRRQAVARVVAFGELAQAQHAAVVLGHLDHFAGRVHGGDGVAMRHEVEPVHGFVVGPHVVVALGAAGMVVEGHAGADDIEQGSAAMAERALDQRHELFLVA